MAPLTVYFTDASTGEVTSWLWTFGDGSTSSEQNPVHVYSGSGTYTVALQVTGPGGSDQLVMTSYITVAPGTPTAAFSAAPLSGEMPLTVSFTDASVGEVASWLWTFGDGSTSVEQNPIDMYTEAGIYTVTLVVTGPGGSDQLVMPDYITVLPDSPTGPTAAFSATPLSGVAPLTVSFTDASTGSITIWLWTFGDGNTSTEQNPVHVYSGSGTFTVALQVTGPLGSDQLVMTNYITVIPGAPTAAFSAAPLSGGAPLTVSFTDASTGEITSWLWNFGDGSISTQQNPIHVYSLPGTYHVTLSVTGPGGQRPGNESWVYHCVPGRHNILCFHPAGDEVISSALRLYFGALHFPVLHLNLG